MYAIRSYYATAADSKNEAKACMQKQILRNIFRSIGYFCFLSFYSLLWLFSKYPCVITSYSIHYTKLYECKISNRTGVKSTFGGFKLLNELHGGNFRGSGHRSHWKSSAYNFLEINRSHFSLYSYNFV